MWICDVAMKMCTLGCFAKRTASQAASMSLQFEGPLRKLESSLKPNYDSTLSDGEAETGALHEKLND